MRVFLSGILNPLGSRVAKLLAKSRHEVTAAVANQWEAEQARALGSHPVVLNLLSVSDVQAALYGQETVVNLATAAGDTRSWLKYSLLRRALSLNLVHGALRNHVGRFIQESAVFLYGESDERWVTEDARLKPDAPSSSAFTAERNVLELEKVGGTPVVLRFAAFYAQDHWETRRILRWARMGFFLMAGPLEGYFPMVHLADAAEAVLHALRAPAGVWNISEDEPFTRRQSAQALAKALGKKRLSLPSPLVA